MFYRKTEFLQVAAELFDSLVVSLNGVGGELAQFIGEPLCFGHLARSYAWSLFVEHELEFDGENFPVLIELLST